MDSLYDYLDKLPETIINLVNDTQYQLKTKYRDLANVQEDLEHYKKHGKFPVRHHTHNSQEDSGENSKTSQQKSERAVLNDNINANRTIKLERISEKLTENVQNISGNRESIKENIKTEKPDIEMPPPQLPVKKTRKVKNTDARNTRSTRSKASMRSNNDYSEDDNVSRESDVILQKEQEIIVNLVDDNDDASQSENENKDIASEKEIKGRITRNTRTRKNTEERDGSNESGKRIRSPSTDPEKKKNKTNRESERESKQTRKTKRQKSEETSEKENSVYEDAESNLQIVNNNKVANQTYVKIRPEMQLNETYLTNENNKLNQTTIVQNNITSNGSNNNVSVKPVLANDTIVIEKGKALNMTVVIEKGPVLNETTVNNKGTPIRLNDIMTDDEDDNVVITTTASLIPKSIKKGTKPIFSPYESSPVKKRVEAFEKLGADSDVPPRSTRTKTRAQNKNKGDEIEETENIVKIQIKEKKETKQTPLMTRYKPSMSASAGKSNKSGFPNESLISTKSASALKASQQEFKERELKRRQKEAEAMKKKDALLQAQIEEKRRKREEKQMKAQQTREAMEKNKQKMLESVEKSKEEKHKQTLAEKQDKLKKQQEETERRRMEAFKKAAEQRRREEERRKAIEEEEKQAELEKERLKHEMKKAAYEERKIAHHAEIKKKMLPIYLRQKAPLLPTEDCYDSDQEEAANRKVRYPAWMSKDRLLPVLRSMQYCEGIVLNNFFASVNDTPDLRTIFQNIDPKKLKRTSSAVWKAPPRFTLMPVTQEKLDEDSQEEEC